MATIQTISVSSIALGFIPVAVTVGILARWQLGAGTALYALARMLGQLVLIGYLLVFIFETDHATVVLAVLSFMLFAASWIAMRPIAGRQRGSVGLALVAIAVGGLATLALVTQGVLAVEPWYAPRYVVPLAGMIFANAMNAVSLAAERFETELESAADPRAARLAAFQAAMIPPVNSLFAVGLVALPGMMTGQILSGVSPLVAVRYQIVVMCMTFGSAGIAAALYLILRIRAVARPSGAGSQ